MNPHPDFYEQATADLGNANISSEALAQIVMRYTQQVGPGQAAPDSNSEEVAALLAAIAQAQRTVNGRFIVYPFKIVTPADGSFGMAFQILPTNPNRKYLAVQFISGTVAALLFDEGPVTPQTLSQQDFIQKLASGIDIAKLGQTGANFIQFNTAPTNAVTIVGGASVAAPGTTTIQGILIEIAK